MDDKEKYLRWLEEMWDAQKFDVHGSAEREEKKTEEILEVVRAPEHLEDLFRLLLLALRAAVDVELLSVPHLLQPAQILFLIVHQFSIKCCADITLSSYRLGL